MDHLKEYVKEWKHSPLEKIKFLSFDLEHVESLNEKLKLQQLVMKCLFKSYLPDISNSLYKEEIEKLQKEGVIK